MKKYTDRQYAVLGLGIFGSTVAKTLSRYNCDVIAGQTLPSPKVLLFLLL